MFFNINSIRWSDRVPILIFINYESPIKAIFYSRIELKLFSPSKVIDNRINLSQIRKYHTLFGAAT